MSGNYKIRCVITLTKKQSSVSDTDMLVSICYHITQEINSTFKRKKITCTFIENFKNITLHKMQIIYNIYIIYITCKFF